MWDVQLKTTDEWWGLAKKTGSVGFPLKVGWCTVLRIFAQCTHVLRWQRSELVYCVEWLDNKMRFGRETTPQRFAQRRCKITFFFFYIFFLFFGFPSFICFSFAILWSFFPFWDVGPWSLDFGPGNVHGFYNLLFYRCLYMGMTICVHLLNICVTP